MGWFFGFKLHIVVNHIGDLLSCKFTKGNIDDRVPVKELCRRLSGKLYGDRGYISRKLFEDFFESGVYLVTNIRSNMKDKLLLLKDKLLLRKKIIIETINDQLKNISDIEHIRHRSPINFMVNLVAGLISYKAHFLSLLSNLSQVSTDIRPHKRACTGDNRFLPKYFLA